MADATLTDPLGRTVVLHDRTWFGHIIKGHPDVRPARILAERAILTPSEIRYSFSDPECRLYYGDADSRGIMMVVVADIRAGVVKTAYRARKMKGMLEWSR